jgi:hypothetical protein
VPSIRFWDSAKPLPTLRSLSAGRTVRLVGAASAVAIGSLLAASPAAAEVCKFAPVRQIDKDAGVMPQLLITADCVDPAYNADTFVVDKTEQLTFQVPGGPLIPYTQITGHFPATNTPTSLPPGVLQDPTLFRQDYEFRFPAKEYFKSRSFQSEHPSGGGRVDNQMAFTNGAYSIRWASASAPNAVNTIRHEAAAAKVGYALAQKLYGPTGKIYNYIWGCSGGGIVAIGHAENVTGVWDGVQPQCMGLTGVSTYHSFHWQALYTMAIPQEKRDAIAKAAAPGGTGEIYAGLNEEEKDVLNEFLSAGYPLPIIGNHFKSLTPLVDPIDIRLADPTYEVDFWTKPGYAGTNPPNYLKAAHVDGQATITGITRDAKGVPTAIQFDPATLPKLGTIGDNYLEYFVYGPDGKTRIIDPERRVGTPTEQRPRFTLAGKLDPATATLVLSGLEFKTYGGSDTPIPNDPILLNALKVGGKIRVNNNFILAMYFYPRYSNIPGIRSYDQYRNADGTPKYPQRKDLSVLAWAQYRTIGARLETGDIKTKTMIIEGRSDNLSWPIINASYAEMIQRTLGPAKADQMMRFYLHDNGRHALGGGEPGVFQQSVQDLMAWAEKGVAPPPSTSYVIRNGQVIPPDDAAARGGLQPVMKLTVNGSQRAEVRVNQPVNLAAKLEMPPKTGQIVQYKWTVDGKDDAAVVVSEPKPLVNVARSLSFDKPGTYLVRLTVNGQRDGLLDPPNQTLMQNFQDVQVVVQ